ncbi:M56 family metallopeptidase [uncultured Dokdonia sp.]|uniref:M56 family metallopeptidase n=1 Tax=Dokdonia sp. R78006 TaxID=3093866 RepID=UPI0026149E10|nr:M56 family metallopeptidase [uncultured Dokdonia sp.]
MILIYLLKSALCLGILFGFYKLALEGKAMHHFKRFYLLASLVFSFTIPLITFTYQAENAPQITPIFQEYVETVSAPNEVPEVSEVDYTNTVIWGIYLLGIFIFGTRFIINLVRLKRKINQAELHPSSHFTLALLEQVIVPHSFLKWIFVNKQSYTQKEIAPEVLAHEATHVRQKHSLDIIAIEFIQVLFWFNPLVWLYKSSIKLNHEFLADQGAIVDKSNIAIYQNILLSYASSTHHTALESPFNYSLTKKRIVMLSQSFSRKKVVLRALLLIPIIGLCVLFFNQGIIAQEKPKEQKAPQTSTYATQFVEGAARNGKNALVIEVKNDSIYVNGQYSPLESFRKSVDNITAQWTKEEFAQPVRSMIFKGNSKEFIKKAEAVFRQTQLYKANNSLRLIPPAPPAPQGQLPPPPPPPSAEEYLVRMRKLGSLFIYEEKEISFDKAVLLVNSNTYNVKTPFPYTNPPKTYISSISQSDQSAEPNNKIKATNTEINTYNKLAKKYNADPERVINGKEVGQIYEIYDKMTSAQREKAVAFPKLPPPPPPSAPKMDKKVGVIYSDKNDQRKAFQDPNKYQTIFSNIVVQETEITPESHPEEIGFTASSINDVSKKINAFESSEKAIASALDKENINSENITLIGISNGSLNKETIKNYKLGGQSVVLGLTKQEDGYQYTETTYLIKKAKED